MSSPTRYDAIIIGAGQAGGPLSKELAGAGLRTALVERTHMGGTCVNEGCTPTKTMVASARVAYLARRAKDFGVSTGAVKVDLKAVRKRKRDIVAAFGGKRPDRASPVEGRDVLFGEARFLDAQQIEVDLAEGGKRVLAADLVFVDTGARPTVPDLPGLDDVPYLDSTSIMELGSVPEHLIVLGGGYVAIEFGQMFRRFGSKVTIVQRGKTLLGREDDDVAEAVLGILREDGVKVLLEARAVRVKPGSGRSLRLSVEQGSKKRTLEGSHLLVATGRTPNSDRLNLPAAGIATDERGFIEVDARLETNVKGVYALGDVKGGPQFTHISYDDYRIVAENVLRGGKRETSNRLVPYTVFMDPELGRVGLSESQARADGREIRVARMPMASVARALEVDESRGLMKVVVDAETDRILGAAVLGVHGGELASLLQVAMMGGVTSTRLRDGIFSHPTLAEALNNLFQNFDDE